VKSEKYLVVVLGDIVIKTKDKYHYIQKLKDDKSQGD
jgi:hypothetical protein